MERATGIEPATPSLGSSYSTAELRPLYRRQCRIISTVRQRGQAYPAGRPGSVRVVTRGRRASRGGQAGRRLRGVAQSTAAVPATSGRRWDLASRPMNSVRAELRVVRGPRLTDDLASVPLRPRPVEQIRFVSVMGAAAELDVLDRGLAPHRVRDDVMELEEAAFLRPPHYVRTRRHGRAQDRSENPVKNFLQRSRNSRQRRDARPNRRPATEITAPRRPPQDQLRMSASTSSRRRTMSSSEEASRFRRNSGSVFDGRTLKCQSA
jgi:hypothetical protein